MDDGTQPFGELCTKDETEIRPAHWDTPEWRAEMEAKYTRLDVFHNWKTDEITLLSIGFTANLD